MSESTSPSKKNEQHANGRGHPVRQTLAEWVTLGISSLLLLSIAAFLVVQAIRSNGSILPIEVRVNGAAAQPVDGRYYLPIEVFNRGTRSLRDLKVQLRYTPPGGPEEEGELEIDYLGEGSSQTVYWIFSDDPRAMNVQAEPVQYRLE